MGKALVIKDVDFSANKLATVSFGNVPCTGISLSQNVINFNSLTPVTLTATLTPSNTTDTLSWASSDTDVATVANGVVTPVGLGTATITATCGQQTATCSVTVEVVLTDADFAIIDHYMLTGTDLSNEKDYVGAYTSSADAYKKYFIYLASASTPSGIKALSGPGDFKENKYPFIVPKNATKIVVSGTASAPIASFNVTFVNSAELCTYISTTSEKGCKAVTNNMSAYASNNKVTITIPDDVDGLDAVCCNVVLTAGSETTPEGITIEFLAE